MRKRHKQVEAIGDSGPTTTTKEGGDHDVHYLITGRAIGHNTKAWGHLFKNERRRKDYTQGDRRRGKEHHRWNK